MACGTAEPINTFNDRTENTGSESEIPMEPSSETTDQGENEEETDPETIKTDLRFTKVPLFDMPGSAFLHPVDLDNDGFEEYLLSAIMLEIGWANGIGPGGAAIIQRDGGAPGDGEGAGGGAEGAPPAASGQAALGFVVHFCVPWCRPSPLGFFFFLVFAFFFLLYTVISVSEE